MSVAVKSASLIDSLDRQHDVENRPPWIIFPVCFGGCKEIEEIFGILIFIAQFRLPPSQKSSIYLENKSHATLGSPTMEAS